MKDKIEMTERQRQELQLHVLNGHIRESEETGFASVTGHSLAIIRMHYAMLLDKSLEVDRLRKALEEAQRYISEVVSACLVPEWIDYNKVITEGNRILADIKALEEVES